MRVLAAIAELFSLTLAVILYGGILGLAIILIAGGIGVFK